MKLTVNEIFYSLQGEGGRTGEASIFVRLTKCNLACSFCDTDFSHGQDMTPGEILSIIAAYPCKWIIWTGGEPTLQLRDEHLQVFREAGYKQAIETNGTNPVPSLIDYIACSPKVKYESVKECIPFAHEIRIPVSVGDAIPDISMFPQADRYFLSPVFDGEEPNPENINYTIEHIKKHPEWALSLQMHKLIKIQ
ncbi:7-carboxy-7-deazaguanine synthase [Dysgonomonas sp. PH5-45]|uniref:7-carboxy-7-deazaguanine synthase QueE n=1 Tax=unclassified Dysgonomonas TaxID=2630389 RepID=UPI0024758A8F|nr:MULTISPECIES: 7-carboxy-7-deazaguanine synthase QueE [unclassified Dysgonomonas]MDH6353793.1 7-carboxy-7-deazaguanine synthase [Dysgonomonas sp. PH5-45]MDH6386695.1 7-carboxy-7-deazaguanine synthase [Dysgonomonas sp. PH5-37]